MNPYEYAITDILNRAMELSSTAPHNIPAEDYRYDYLDDMLYMCIGISTEAGELLDSIQKHKFQGREFNRLNMLEEAGDILFYLLRLISLLDSDIIDVVGINRNKLAERYPGGWSPSKCNNRDLRKEVAAMVADK